MTRPTEINYVTCPYGKRGSWLAGYHTGIDYRAAVGSKIFATKGGKVVHSGFHSRYGPAYGNHVVIESWYKGKKRQHLYAHLSRSLVKEGQRVRAGNLIGNGGETGNTFGPHLHYEERFHPFNYWSHYPPVLVTWQPLRKRVLRRILRKIAGKTKK